MSSNLVTHSPNSQTLISLNGNNAIAKFENNLTIIIPCLLSFVGIFLVMISLCHCFRKRDGNSCTDSDSLSILSETDEEPYIKQNTDEENGYIDN
eukprot:999811_1